MDYVIWCICGMATMALLIQLLMLTNKSLFNAS